jgi:hypothetical protein
MRIVITSLELNWPALSLVAGFQLGSLQLLPKATHKIIDIAEQLE